MKRPRKHIIQTISNKAFANIIPDEWAARELDQDYGLDFMVEIFEEEESTGKLLFVQLKGTDDKPENDSITYQLKRTHLDYYNSIPNPILFVIYSIPAKTFWAVWTNNLKDFLETKKDDQKSSLLRLYKDQIIDKSYFEDLPSYFSADLPDKFVFDVKTDSKITEKYSQKLLEWLSHFFPNTIVEDKGQLTQRIYLDIQTLESKDISVNIKYSIESTELVIENIQDSKYLFMPVPDFSILDKTLTPPLTHLGLLLSDKNISGVVSLLIRCIEVNSEIGFSPETMMSLGTNILRNGNIDLLQNLIDSLIEAGLFNEFQLMNFLLLQLKDDKYTKENKSKLYQNNLNIALQKINDQKFVGVLNYNLANSYRNSGENYLSSSCYQKARKNEPKYLERSYWWFEYAGVLFLSNHYKFAEDFYKKSNELGIIASHGNIIWALIGDCLFFQGKFSEAKSYFEKYMTDNDKLPDEYFLKFDVCRNMILADLDCVEINEVESNKLMETPPAEMSEELLQTAIGLNPLNPLAWFNYGVFLHKDKPKLAFMAYLTSGSIAEWDIEAWTNCLLISWNFKRMEKILIFYKIILNRFGDKSINYLANQILDDPEMPKETKIGLIEGFKKIADELNKPTPNTQ